MLIAIIISFPPDLMSMIASRRRLSFNLPNTSR